MKIELDAERMELTITLELSKLPARWSPGWLVMAAKICWASWKSIHSKKKENHG